MNVTINTSDDYVKSVIIEYTPAESLVINQALRRYVQDDNVNNEDRAIAKQMIERYVL